MGVLYVVAFLLFIAAIFLAFQASPKDFLQSSQNVIYKLHSKRKVTLKQKIKQSVKKRRIRGIRKTLSDAKNVLVLTHRTDRMHFYTTISVSLAFAGILISSFLDNFFLMPVLAVGMALLPWLYILYNAVFYQKQLNDELQTTLSMITTSYLRNDNFILAVKENIGNINYPVREIFEKFLVQSEMISSDITELLEEMKGSLDNAVFQDWVNQIILCMKNRTLKSTLQPIVSRLSKIRKATGDLDNLMYDSVNGFISFALLLIINIPLMRLMYSVWYDYVMYTTVGQIIVAVTFIVIFISLSACISKIRPAEDRR